MASMDKDKPPKKKGTRVLSMETRGLLLIALLLFLLYLLRYLRLANWRWIW